MVSVTPIQSFPILQHRIDSHSMLAIENPFVTVVGGYASVLGHLSIYGKNDAVGSRGKAGNLLFGVVHDPLQPDIDTVTVITRAKAPVVVDDYGLDKEFRVTAATHHTTVHRTTIQRTISEEDGVTVSALVTDRQTTDAGFVARGGFVTQGKEFIDVPMWAAPDALPQVLTAVAPKVLHNSGAALLNFANMLAFYLPRE